MKIKKKDMIYLKAGILSAVTVICFISVYLWDNSREIKTNENGEQILERSENGENQTHKMKVRIGEKESDMDISVSGRMYNSKELNIAFQTASEELETLILGENKSLDEVRSNLDLITAIPDTDISVSWQTDRYDVIDMQGNLQKDSMEEEGTVVKLTAVLSYADEKAAHEFYVKVYPPLQNDDERIMEDLQTSIVRSDEKTATEEYMVLPDSVNGEKIQWKYGTDQRAAAILVIGIGAAGMLIISEGQRKKEEEKKNSRQMRIDYPQIINKFNLYIRAGMTIRRAWFLIVRDYEKKHDGKKRKAYEEMIFTMNQMQGGVPEGECYENYGKRCGISCYRKLGTMLSQNLKKGSGGLSQLLEREAQESFEDRKNLAKKMGEEAGTKLMIPMFLMLIIVFAIVIIPAFFSIRI